MKLASSSSTHLGGMKGHLLHTMKCLLFKVYQKQGNEGNCWYLFGNGHLILLCSY